MIKLHFRDTRDFEGLFKNKKRNVTDGIVSGIEEAMKLNKTSAPLFELTFESVDRMFEISLPQAEWVHALESCLDHYHELGEADQAIDTWKLLETAKVW